MHWVNQDANFFKIMDKNILEIENDKKLFELFEEYAGNFRIASNILLNYILDEGESSALDTYFFAIAFLYRHSLELKLKSVYLKNIKEENKVSNFFERTRHNLSEILKEIEDIGKIDESTKEFQWLKLFFNDIEKIDKESDAFRYPFKICYRNNIVGKEYYIIPIFKKRTEINLIKFGNKMELAYQIIDSFDKKISLGDDFIHMKPVLLEEGGGFYTKSVIGWVFNLEEFHPYVESYKLSAEYLYSFSESNLDKLENLFFPICYLYRNCLELSLKEIILEESSMDIQNCLKKVNNKKHKILGLWNLIVDEIRAHAEPLESDKTDEYAENYIRQLNNIDPQADKFRYPCDKKANVYFKNGKILDLYNIDKYFKEIINTINSACIMMAHNNELMREMEAEYLSNYR